MSICKPSKKLFRRRLLSMLQNPVCRQAILETVHKLEQPRTGLVDWSTCSLNDLNDFYTMDGLLQNPALPSIPRSLLFGSSLLGTCEPTDLSTKHHRKINPFVATAGFRFKDETLVDRFFKIDYSETFDNETDFLTVRLFLHRFFAGRVFPCANEEEILTLGGRLSSSTDVEKWSLRSARDRLTECIEHHLRSQTNPELYGDPTNPLHWFLCIRAMGERVSTKPILRGLFAPNPFLFACFELLEQTMDRIGGLCCWSPVQPCKCSAMGFLVDRTSLHPVSYLIGPDTPLFWPTEPERYCVYRICEPKLPLIEPPNDQELDF